MAEISITSLEGTSFSAYVATPVRGGPGLIVIPEASGVTEDMKRLCDFYAKQDILVLCPDLFSRTPVDVEACVRHLIDTLGYTRRDCRCNGKVGAVGYGLGGRLAYLMATRSDVDVSVCYCPVDLEKNIDEIYDASMPLMLHLAANDALTTPEKRAALLRKAARNTAITAHVYEGVGHGFALKQSPTFNAEAARLAGERTAALLAETLKA